MERKHYILGHHLVAFLDLLEQREKLRQLTPDEHARVEQVLRDTARLASESNPKHSKLGLRVGHCQCKIRYGPISLASLDSFAASVALT